jgi:hypothetical protein
MKRYTISQLLTKVQLINILWCLFYIALVIVLYLDLMVWRPN